MAIRIFLSYRRDDSADATGRISDRLFAAFGNEHVFVDVDGIQLGADFVKQLTSEIARCDVFLAVIGPRWLDARNDIGERRLDDPNDFVRIEVQAALQRSIPFVPIFVGGAKAPKPDLLPEEIRDLAFRSGLDLRHATFHSDVDRLIRELRKMERTEDNGAPAPLPHTPQHWPESHSTQASTSEAGSIPPQGSQSNSSSAADNSAEAPSKELGPSSQNSLAKRRLIEESQNIGTLPEEVSRSTTAADPEALPSSSPRLAVNATDAIMSAYWVGASVFGLLVQGLLIVPIAPNVGASGSFAAYVRSAYLVIVLASTLAIALTAPRWKKQPERSAQAVSAGFLSSQITTALVIMFGNLYTDGVQPIGLWIVLQIVGSFAVLRITMPKRNSNNGSSFRVEV